MDVLAHACNFWSDYSILNIDAMKLLTVPHARDPALLLPYSKEKNPDLLANMEP